jgi:GNAT superfamily N-acetyltransferase
MARQPPELTEQQRLLGRYLAALRNVAHVEAGSQLPDSHFWETADRVMGANGALIARRKKLIVVEIRPAAHSDIEAITLLMEDLDRFYGATDIEPPSKRVSQIAAALFREPRAAYALLAREGERLVGMAAYSFLWPAAGVTRSLYLKELYIAETVRGKGIGTLLMQRLCQVAVEHACSRVEWTTDKGNVLGESFYERRGAPKNQDKIFYRLEGADIRRAFRHSP